MPHQVMREFWRNRHSAIQKIPAPKRPLQSVRSDLFALVNDLRPDSERTADLAEIKDTIDNQLTELEAAIEEARGAPLDKDALLRDTSVDPVVSALESLLRDRVGPPFEGEEEAELVDVGLQRFESKVPPGYEDSEPKRDQLPERGTGDFLLWEQTLRQMATLGGGAGFIVVSNETRKGDWRISQVGGQKRPMGVRPELVAEALARTGRSLVLLTASDFYRLMVRLRNEEDSPTSDTLIKASARVGEEGASASGSPWSLGVFRLLLQRLRRDGYSAQADVIMNAAENGGFVDRSAIYELAGFDEDTRSLRRFSFPAARIAVQLVGEGLLAEGEEAPLEAVYERPGKARGYEVPASFVEFVRQGELERSSTWLEAARIVLSSDIARAWRVAEIVDAIRERGLRDLSAAKTPEKTLARDLRERGHEFAEEVSPGTYRYRAV